MNRVTGLCAILAAVLCTAAYAQVQYSQIDAVFSKFESPNAPGGAVLVLRDGKTLFEKGYGAAELRTLARITPATNFRLASCSKQFTAMAIMLLVHDGKLRYDNGLTDVFPEFPAYGKAITVRQLLNHTSGLKDYEDLYSAKYPGVPDEKIPQIQDAGVLKLLEAQASTDFAPGSRWRYSNSGYVVLGLIVEKVSGEPFGKFLHERIFRPLGMTQTVMYEKGKNEVKNRAYGHTCDVHGCRETDQSSTSATRGDGGIYSSITDLAKWDAALNSYKLLPEKEMREAWTPATVPASPNEVMQTGQREIKYGFGWFLDPYRRHKRMWHYGETRGFRTTIQRFPDDKLTVIVLANREDADAAGMALRVVDLYLK